MQKIRVITTGGTIDKVYFDAQSDYQIGRPAVEAIFAENGVPHELVVEELFRKDSLDLTDQDRHQVRNAVEKAPEKRILVTHGTDTMVETARSLGHIAGKVIVFTGSLQPAGFKNSDAVFNVGCALGVLMSREEGIYIVMNGQVFYPGRVHKNRELNRFEAE
jgi:L-asparaginase